MSSSIAIFGTLKDNLKALVDTMPSGTIAESKEFEDWGRAFVDAVVSRSPNPLSANDIRNQRLGPISGGNRALERGGGRRGHKMGRRGSRIVRGVRGRELAVVGWSCFDAEVR
jgi:hypothetical protein